MTDEVSFLLQDALRKGKGEGGVCLSVYLQLCCLSQSEHFQFHSKISRIGLFLGGLFLIFIINDFLS